MYQLFLPCTRSRRNNGVRINIRTLLFGDNKTMPCVFCKKELTLETSTSDHIIPRSRGGSNTIENLNIACEDCNGERGDIDFDEWNKNWRSIIAGRKVRIGYNQLVDRLYKLKLVVNREKAGEDFFKTDGILIA